ncbi:hypothetical protein ANCCAN_11566 [Ancylostoma caninum]|uniref:DNA-directed RNA polymerase n=2 Tax=Ancylostoma TaxID=29169 RepID=A0A368GFL7_ANCCA|nr:hypothetical protein ANCCAN_11566 [Ancylostoma caninum]
MDWRKLCGGFFLGVMINYFQEMNNVFAVYGIEVSKRHLSLTADYMTFTGEIAPFNRAAMSSSSSPLQKMTFETTMAFMKEALLHGMFWGS